MSRKKSMMSARTVRGSNLSWDPNSKEPWHFQLEKNPLNDKKWSCIVTAAVPTEVHDQEYIQIYNQYVSLGLRKAIKTITISDVIELLKGNNNDSKNNIKNGKNKNDKTKPEQETQKMSGFISKPSTSPFFQIVDLAAKYAVVTETEVKLPPDLMAAVIKYLILVLKDESCLQKKIDAVKERKTIERNIKTKFIRNLKSFEMIQEKENTSDTSVDETFDLQEPVNDEPIDGPDLYVMLVDFYDLNVFFEFEKMNVPFLAFLKFSANGTSGFSKDSTSLAQKSDVLGKKKSLILSFWEKYESECSNLEKMENYKNIAIVKYEPTFKPIESNVHSHKSFFNEVSWTLYSIYYIYRQHQKYLQELHVQRLIMSLQPLDLSECGVYNKLCDALILGQPLTPMLILHSIIEQVIAGVPETTSVALEYQPQPSDFFSDGSKDLESFKKTKKQKMTLITPCLQCKDKKYEHICEKLKKDVGRSNESLDLSLSFSKIPAPEEYSEFSQNQNTMAEELDSFSTEYILPEFLLDQALSERQSGKDLRNKKKWKTPSTCLFGDSVFVQTYHSQPRLFETEIFVERFLKSTDLPQVWTKYPESLPGDRAFYNFHFSFLKKISKKSEEVLKLYIHFTLSMNLLGMTKSFMFKGDEMDEPSHITMEEDDTQTFKMKVSKDIFNLDNKNNFDSYFFKNFIPRAIGNQKKERKKPLLNIGSVNSKKLFIKDDINLLRKVKNEFLTSVFFSGNPQFTNPYFSAYVEKLDNYTNISLTNQQNDDKELIILFALLNCLEISSLTLPLLINKENFAQLVQDFKFYETFEPYLMIQRLFEAQDNFNTTQFSYFPPTDSVVILMYDDYDHRGVHFSTITQALPTPVRFRDFYFYVYDELNYWLTEEIKEHKKFVEELQEKAAVERKKKEAVYLSQLKRYYCGMSEEEKKVFLETDLEDAELEITEKELEDLPLKPKPPLPDKLSFVGTNYLDSRVEFTRKTQEFCSQDGTEVNAKIENWLYAPSNLLRILLKRSNFRLYYNQWLQQGDIETSFTFKTESDIIFSFFKSKHEEKEEEEEKNEEEGEEEKEEEQFFNYQVTISWPTGLLIQTITLNSIFYIKQNYIKNCRKGWDIEVETSRCFVRNGQVVIFKECGDYDVLCPSGTKYTFFESGVTPKYELTTTTGEIWEIITIGRCKNRKNLRAKMKVFVGVDAKAKEIFYKREDGVYCMLWPNGKLVTTYPDGTKITTIPDFDENEIDVGWTEEEKLLLKEILMQSKFEREQSINKNPNSSIHKSSITLSDRKLFDDKFVSISCSYLIEHPKYSSVYLNAQEDYIRLSMPDDISMFICPGKNYTIQKKWDFLKVCETTVEFFAECPECSKQTTATLFLNENEILCKCVDFFEKVFLVYRNGKATYLEKDITAQEKELDKKPETQKCSKSHKQNKALEQRCFVLERDLSGVEFHHKDSIAVYSEKLSEDTFLEINTADPDNVTHTFISPYYKVGHENWEMNYVDIYDSLPTNLKKKDLKEIGVQENTKNVFKYPFPKWACHGNRHSAEKPKKNLEMPKLIIARTIKVWPENPQKVIDKLQNYVAEYEIKVFDIWKKYRSNTTGNHSENSRRVMRLRKIALTLNQSLQMYPHLCTQFPSTEKEIHYFGHFVNSMADIKSHFPDLDDLPDCKQIPIPLPRISDFPPIYEESKSLNST